MCNRFLRSIVGIPYLLLLVAGCAETYRPAGPVYFFDGSMPTSETRRKTDLGTEVHALNRSDRSFQWLWPWNWGRDKDSSVTTIYTQPRAIDPDVAHSTLPGAPTPTGAQPGDAAKRKNPDSN